MIKQSFIILCCLVFASACKEQSLPVHEFVKGSFTQIQQQNQGSPYLVLFWSEQCVYCLKELELFGHLDKKQSKFKLITVSTDPFMNKGKIRQQLSEFNLADVEAWVFSEAHAETLYFDVDRQWRGELPISFIFDEKNNKIKKMGMLKPSDLTAG